MNTNPYAIKVMDISLASALLTLGCRLDTVNPFYKYQCDKGTTLIFFFLPDENINKLINIWNDPEVDKTHDIAMLKIFNMNRIGISKEIKDAPGLIEIHKNGRTVLMTSTCTEEQKAKLLSRL